MDTIINGALLELIASHCRSKCPKCNGSFTFIHFGESTKLRCMDESCALELSIIDFIIHYSKFDITTAITEMQQSEEFNLCSKVVSPEVTDHFVCAEDGEFFESNKSNEEFMCIDLRIQKRTPVKSFYEMFIYKLSNTDFKAMNEHLIPPLTLLSYCILSKVPAVKGSSDERFLHLIVILPSVCTNTLLPAVIKKIDEVSKTKASQFYYEEISTFYSDLDLKANNWGIGLGKVAREMNVEHPG